MKLIHILFVNLLIILVSCQRQQLNSAIQGVHCAKNQVVNKVTFYEDGAIEAECGRIPCGNSGDKCVENQTNCRSDTPFVFSGMKWASNGQSLLLRCCSLDVGNKMYVGTDMITLGSFYSGGIVEPKDKFGHGGDEYDFVSNVRIEQSGIRIWVHRIMCASNSQTQQQPQQSEIRRAPPSRFDGVSTVTADKRRQEILRQLAESHDSNTQVIEREEVPRNPLQYRPRQMRDQPLDAESRIL